MTKIEQVARAMFDNWRECMIREGEDDVAATLEELDDKERAFAFRAAKAAIEAMREPSEAMIDAASWDALSRSYAATHWKAMCSAALKETQ